MSVIKKLKKTNLRGRSGSGFPVWQKWQAVKKAKSEKKYAVCNAAEGEPGSKKDGLILEKYPQEAVSGLKLAMEEAGATKGFIYLKKSYYKKFGANLRKLIAEYPISLIEKPGGYLAGEEGVLCNAIEGKPLFPRAKPPYPTEQGIWNRPTLVNNIETLLMAWRIYTNSYEGERFFTIGGEAKKPGVFVFPQSADIADILERGKNYPDFDFFVQAGGGAMGEILLPKEIEKPLKGCGVIIIHKRRNARKFILDLLEFFMEENCDKCVPCREGILRIYNMVKKEKINKKILENITFSLKNSSFCAFGECSALPIKTAIEKLL